MHNENVLTHNSRFPEKPPDRILERGEGRVIKVIRLKEERKGVPPHPGPEMRRHSRDTELQQPTVSVGPEQGMNLCRCEPQKWGIFVTRPNLVRAH